MLAVCVGVVAPNALAQPPRDWSVTDSTVTADEDERMPPPDDNNKPLSEAQIAKLRAWIDAGAEWPEGAAAGSSHWSFQPIVRPVVPEVTRTLEASGSLVRNPIDAFLLARLQNDGFTFADEAAPAVLLRRLFLDLVGIPPSSAGSTPALKRCGPSRRNWAGF